jgi:hypothetical protein
MGEEQQVTISFVRAFTAASRRLLAIAVSTIVVLSLAAGGAAAASPLPDGRAYELVSPAEKQGGFVNEFKIYSSPSGNAVAYDSPYAFLGEPSSYLFYNAYAASRTPNGWNTVPLNPAQGPNDLDPGGEPPTIELENFAAGDPLRPIFNTTFGLSSSDLDGNRIDVYTRNSTGGFTWDSPPEAGVKTTATAAFFAGASSTGNSIAWQATTPLAANDTHEFGEELYATTADHTELVGILPGNVVPKCGAMLGDGINSEEANLIKGKNAFGGEVRNAVSPDGHQIIFSSPDWGATQVHIVGEVEGEADPSCAVPRQVYARINGTTTVQISASQRTVPDPNGEQSAYYAGASADGSRIFFISSQELTNDDTTHAPELYEYNMSSGELTRISAGDSGVAEGSVDGIAAISSDGQRIYFAAHGEPLAPGATGGNEAMYLYEHGHTTLVGMVPDAEFRDLSLPNNFLGGGPAQRNTDSTPSGGVLVFVSGENLTGENETHVAELYRYSALDASLICVSCDRTTTKPVGEVAFPVSEQALTSPPINVMNESGSEVFFQTESGLVPIDGNHKSDVYEWEAAGSGSCTTTSTEYSSKLAGCQYLISNGRDSAGATLGDVSPDGANVFFTTWDSLVKEDRDLNRDVYDARVGGGFSAPETSAPCSADGCQGAASQGPLRSIPGSSTQAAGENVPGGTSTSVPSRPKLSRAQLLARALKVCARRPKGQRARCNAAAHRKFGVRRHTKATKTDASRKGQA